MKQHFVSLILVLLVFTPLGFSQGSFTNRAVVGELPFQVQTLYPPNSISREQFNSAKHLVEFDRFLKRSWIKTYRSVEVLTSHKGKVTKTLFKNDELNQELKDLIARADTGAAIKVRISYIPENNLAENDPKEMDFTWSFIPDKEAEFPGGAQALSAYLKENAIDNIPSGTFEGYDFAAVKFTVNEEGQIGEVLPSELSKNEQVNASLMKVIANMPCWKPAEFANGLKVRQEKILLVGNMENCMINLLGIRGE
jgi:hypothetical protein